MTKKSAKWRRRFFVPEVVQTSAMDCGPASLKCLLEGFGIPISYGRLREACQTEVDGTSINTMEEIAVQLGLEAEQIMLPKDHMLLAEARALPAIVVVCLPNGLTHFVVVWRRHGRFVQIMDPAIGRRWLTEKEFLRELYVHTMPVPALAWREWAGSAEFLDALRRRLADLKLSKAAAKRIIETGLADPSWRSLAALDAATRMLDSLVRSGGVRRGRQAARVLEVFFERAQKKAPDQSQTIPAVYWSVQPGSSTAEGGEQLLLRGAVLMRVREHQSAARTLASEEMTDSAPMPKALSPELVAALEEPPSRPGRELIRLLRADGLFAPTALVAALVLAAGGVIVEALLFRGLFDVGRELNLSGQRLGAVAALLGFVTLLLLLELPITASMLRLGRRLEARLRIAFLEKIPRLGDRYFHSRLTSDMAERSHTIHRIRLLPTLGGQFLRSCFELALTTVGIIWLDPASAPIALLAAALVVGLPLAAQPLLTERDLRLRSHVGALSRFYLDALLGLVAVRAHGAERAVRREHEGLLVEWARAGLGLQRIEVAIEGFQLLVGFGLAAWLLMNHLGRAGEAGGVLLLVYWVLNLPVLGQEIAVIARQYPIHRNVTLRLLEPLGAPDTIEERSVVRGPRSVEEQLTTDNGQRDHSSGVAITMKGASVKAAGHTILEEIELAIEAGSHVAIVGPSGAGKSSLVGILLGWHVPITGQVLVDGVPLDAQRLQWLRQQTTWVDPAVQLWNRSLLDNLRYGAPESCFVSLQGVIEAANLRTVLEKLPDGLQTQLGEGGGLVSGGEGQQVRLGRALMRPGVRLVILDEPFRGLDRQQRRELLARARRVWRNATLLCITHDVGETRAFDRVLIVEAGRIVEDDDPADLAERPDSRYRALLHAEEEVRKRLWSGTQWRRLWLEDGRLIEDRREETVGAEGYEQDEYTDLADLTVG